MLKIHFGTIHLFLKGLYITSEKRVCLLSMIEKEVAITTKTQFPRIGVIKK